MAVAEILVPGAQTGTRVPVKPIESFEGRQNRQRVRLTSEESRRIRYVFCEWASDAGAGGNMGAQLERLAQDPRRLGWAKGQGQRVGYDVMYVHAAAPSHHEQLWAQERWCERAEPERRAILRSWRAMQAMRDVYVVALFALYGERPPGLPERRLWAEEVDAEYARVCRIVLAVSPAEYERQVDAECKRRPGEGHGANITRRLEATSDVGRKCETLIAGATFAYRDAWKTS